MEPVRSMLASTGWRAGLFLAGGRFAPVAAERVQQVGTAGLIGAVAGGWIAQNLNWRFAFMIVGLGDKAVAESRERVRAALIASGLAVGISGLVAASQTGQGSPTAGVGFELSVITAVVLSGASLAGGRGTIFGTILGVLIIGVINDIVGNVR